MTSAENRQSTLSIAGNDIMWKTKQALLRRSEALLSTIAPLLDQNGPVRAESYFQIQTPTDWLHLHHLL